MNDIDCTQYLATSAKTGELLTRDGRVLVSTRTEWERTGPVVVRDLIPCPQRPFGAVDFIYGTEHEVTVDEIAAIIKAEREDGKGDTDYRMAEAIHARLYGQKTEEDKQR